MKLVTILLLFAIAPMVANSQQPQVLTLGTFHFNFPNMDVKKVDKTDQIDVFDTRYQNEIEDITIRLAKFKPTIIVIEREPGLQWKTDSMYNQYVLGNYKLKRSEAEQIGYRLAKQLHLKKLYCVDEWGNFNNNINDLLEGKDSIESRKFEDYFEKNVASKKGNNRVPLFKSKGILTQLIQMNSEVTIKNDLSSYLTGLFKYESKEGDFTGVDFETGRWFSRNLKIYRNIQRINPQPSDRILIIYGAGHLNLLNYFLDCSSEYDLLKVNDFLK